MPNIYGFDSNSTRRIARAVRTVEKMKSNLAPLRANRRGTSSPSPDFPAIITSHTMLAQSTGIAVGGTGSSTVQYRWFYVWSEAELSNIGNWQVKSGGRSGSAACNDAEDFHTGTFSWGWTITSTSYPPGHRPKAVGGANNATDQTVHSYNVLVNMRVVTDVSGTARYRFNKEWGHSGTCT